MKHHNSPAFLLLSLMVGLVANAPGQPANAPAKKTGLEAAPAGDAQTAPALTSPVPADQTAPGTPATPVGEGDKGLRLNFRGVPLEMVLNYLSDAAGFIINIKPGTDIKGKVDVWSNQPLTKDEAVDLLNTVLNQNGYAAVRKERTPTIMGRKD